MEFLRVRLQAPATLLDAVAAFYAARLGIEQLERGDALVAFGVGETRLELVPSETQPFYHFALLVPGNRFRAALDWIGERVELLPNQESGDVIATPLVRWRQSPRAAPESSRRDRHRAAERRPSSNSVFR